MCLVGRKALLYLSIRPSKSAFVTPLFRVFYPGPCYVVAKLRENRIAIVEHGAPIDLAHCERNVSMLGKTIPESVNVKLLSQM